MGKKFIQAAIKRPGALRKKLKAKKGKDIPLKKLDKAAKAKGLLGKQARFAEMLRKLPKRGKK